MKGDDRVLKALNAVLQAELTAINQYFLHSRMLESWGFNSLAGHVYEESIDEMKHADALARRILLLEGLPNFQDLGRLRVAENAQEVFQADLALEREALPRLREGIALCEQLSDFVSRSRGSAAISCATSSRAKRDTSTGSRPSSV